MLKKIVIIGPESTGKSTLCKKLADHYHTLWCPEYAREYLLRHGTDYSFEDLLKIAEGQLNLEDDLLQKILQNQDPFKKGEPQMLFIDTDMYVMKVWCEYVFGKCHHIILDKIAERKYDFYLLCNIDLPWVIDALREYPNEEPRKELFHIYKDILVNQSTPWVMISGNYEERLLQAVQVLNTML